MENQLITLDSLKSQCFKWPTLKRKIRESIEFSQVPTYNGTGCWIWHWLRRSDYGILDIVGPNGKKQYQAHVVLFTIAFGEFPAGYESDHLCRIKPCVNPWHIEPVTLLENQLRKASANTSCRRGHAYADGNWFWNSSGKRECAICRREYMRAYKKRTCC